MLHTSVAASILTILIPVCSPLQGSGDDAQTTGTPTADGEDLRDPREGDEGKGSEEDSTEAGISGDAGGAPKAGHREAFQRHLFDDCRLVERILEAAAINEDSEKAQEEQFVDPEPAAWGSGDDASSTPPAEDGGADPGGAAATTAGESGAAPEVDMEGGEKPAASSGAGGEEAGEGFGGGGDAATGEAQSRRGEGRRRPRPGRRLGHMGHVLLLSRAVVDAENMQMRETDRPATLARGEAGANGTGGVEGIERDGAEGGGAVKAEEIVATEAAAAAAGGGVSASRKSFVAGLLAKRECAPQWQDFVETTLVQELGRQLNPLGGFAVPSREDENQLSSDFPDEVGFALVCFLFVWETGRGYVVDILRLQYNLCS